MIRRKLHLKYLLLGRYRLSWANTSRIHASLSAVTNNHKTYLLAKV